MKGLLIVAIFALTTSTVFGDIAGVCKGHPLGKHVNHPDSCEKYVVCIGGGVVVNCPAGTHFNKELQVCDWLERAGCSTGSSGPQSGAFGQGNRYPINSDLNGSPNGLVPNRPPYQNINTGGSVHHYRPPYQNEIAQNGGSNHYNGLPNQNVHNSGSANSNTSPFAEVCKGQPLGKRVNHPDTCEKFVVCIGGGVSQNCPAGTHFSKKYEVCDWLERAECA